MKKFLQGYKSLTLHTAAYSFETVVNTCYYFIDKYYFFLDVPGRIPHKVIVYFKPKKGTRGSLTLFVSQFKNELLYSALRLQLAKNHRRLREYIVGSALYSHLMPSENEVGFLGEGKGKSEDPLGIGVPWEEKYAAKKA